MKSGNLNLLEPSGPLQACNGTTLSLLLISKIWDSLLHQTRVSKSICNFTEKLAPQPCHFSSDAVFYPTHQLNIRATSPMVLRFLHLLLGPHISLLHIPSGMSPMCLSYFRTCDFLIVRSTTMLPSALQHRRDFRVCRLYGCVILTNQLLENGLVVSSFMAMKCGTAVYIDTRVKCLYGRTLCILSITSVGGSFRCGICLYPD
jgi:hypothetical protein